MVHDLATGAPKLSRSAHSGVAHQGVFCWEDPNLVCSAGSDGTLEVLDLRDQAARFWEKPSSAANFVSWRTSLGVIAAHGGDAVHTAIFPEAHMVLSGGADNKLKRWDLRAGGGPVCELEYLGHTAPIRSLTLSPDKRFLVTGCEDGSARVWHRDPHGEFKAARDRVGAKKLREGEQQLKRNGYAEAKLMLNGHVALVSSCAWQGTEGGARIATSSWDQAVHFFDLDLRALEIE